MIHTHTYTHSYIRVHTYRCACAAATLLASQICFSARAMHVRACRATLLHLKSQSANSKPAPKPWRPPPEALVRLANNSHKVLYLATLHRKCTRALTFENCFFARSAHSRHTRSCGRNSLRTRICPRFSPPC
jgi:hypothetical protein